MEIDDLRAKWTDHVKGIKKYNPPQPNLLSEAEGVSGALARFNASWEAAEALIDRGLLKKLVPAIAAAENATKEIAGFVAASNSSGQGATLLTSELDRELDQFVKDAKAFKAALAKFEKQTN